MTTFTVPDSYTHPTTGEELYLPGHTLYVPGTDVTDPIVRWLTATIGDDGYTGMSGPALSPNTIQFRDETYWLEFDFVWGLYSTLGSTLDLDGRTWPSVQPHAWKNITIQGGRWYASDPTKYAPGSISITGTVHHATNVGDVVVDAIDPPLTDDQIDRINSDTTFLSAAAPYQAQFQGGGRTNTVRVTASPTGELLLALGTVFGGEGTIYPNTGVAMTVDDPPRMPRRRNGFQQFSLAAPGSWPDGTTNRDGTQHYVERACMNRDITLRDLTIEGPNTDGWDAVTEQVEEWNALQIRSVDGLNIESSVYILNAGSDFLNLAGASQVGIDDAGVRAENVTCSAQCDRCGRHAITNQGSYNLDTSGMTALHVKHWTEDSEPTSDGGRNTRTKIRAAAFDHGVKYSMATAHPLGFSAEPPRTEDGISQGPAANLIRTPVDVIDADDINADVTGTGIPFGTYITRRLAPDLIELSQDVAITGTISIGVWSGMLYRDQEWDRVGIASGNPSLVGSAGASLSRVYFTFDAVKDSKILGTPIFDERVDGLTFTTDDLVGKRITFDAGGNLFAQAGANGIPTAVTPTAITMPTAAKATVAARDYTNCQWWADSRRLVTTTNQFSATDKGRSLTGPGIRPGTKIARFVNGKEVQLSRPASADGTGTVAASNARAWVALAPAEWKGRKLHRVRNISQSAKYQGTLAGYVNPGAPNFMFPQRQTGIEVTQCFVPMDVGNTTTAAQAYADVAAMTTIRTSSLIGNNTGFIKVATSTGTAIFSYTSRTGTPTGFAGLTLISGSGSVASGAQVDTINYYGIGQYDAPDYVIGVTGTVSENYFPNGLDNQMPDPTTTVGLTLSITDDPDLARPTFQVVADQDLDGEAVALWRNGVIRRLLIFDGDTATGQLLFDTPSPGPWDWTARWAGSYNTLPATSNTVTQYPVEIPPTATTTTLDASPASPTDEGTTVTLTAAVTPTPDGGQVIFRDGTTTLGTVPLTAGTADLDVTFAAGTHDLVATYQGTATFAPSSDALTYTATAVVPVDTTPPTVLVLLPEDGTTDCPTSQEVYAWFSEPVTGPEDVPAVRMVDEQDAPVAGTLVMFDDEGVVWQFLPAAPFARGAAYTIVAGTATVDLAGNALAAPVVATFTTAAPIPRFAPSDLRVAR